MPRTFIDLFAGIGGFHWALKDLGYECLLAVEQDDAAKEVYRRNFPEAGKPGEKVLNRLVGDIRTLTRHVAQDQDTELKPDELTEKLEKNFGIKKGDVGIICGGFPCQPFSKSGQQKGDKDKTRGTLFRDILLLTKALKPDYLILENVRNLAGKKHVDTLATIITSIRSLGYEIEDEPIILSPHQLTRKYGNPQIRDRVFILARREGLKAGASPSRVAKDVKFQKESAKLPWDAGSVLCKNVTAKFRLNKSERRWISIWEKFLRITEGMKLPGHPIWTDEFEKPPAENAKLPKWKKHFIRLNQEFYRNITKDPKRKKALRRWLRSLQQEKKVDEREDARVIPASRRKFEWQANRAFKDGEERTLRKLLIQFRPSGIRVKPATHFPALVAITQTTVIGPLVGSETGRTHFRYLTPKEAARLQGMYDIEFGTQPDSLSYKQLGNAVNVGVIRYLAERLTGKVPCGKQ